MILSEVITQMKKLDFNKNPVPFTISFRTYNKQNKFGGKLLTEFDVVMCQAPKKPGKKRLANSTPFKNPNHFANRTINIKNTHGDIKTVNTLFITEFNGYQVIL